MTEYDSTPRPAALGLAGLAVAFGIIGVSVGFATLLGLTATASGGSDTTGFGPMAVTAASSLVLGLLLIAGAVLLWRAHRAARVVIGAAVTLLAASSLVRMALDSITFISVLGSVLSLCALAGMGYLLLSDGVRDHVREGVPLRLH
ncbi:hypothetical protein [Rhodococcus sp. IEGM 1408]|uniref:hypothetical protein n=1 Tax=Rhodococcus sp. IEGM 1408 TaxID=3082220 RepID=UPI002954A4AC|nr:hypothetical protein [Rhodococcus sp. IEGM 1408]MDV8000948.1 hypothetical protein [Rhodococcus sp. IEGM 1408]